MAASAAPILGACHVQSEHKTSPAVVPPIFVAHGSPFLIDDEPWLAELRAWSTNLPRPSSILVISAHWLHRPLTLSATRRAPLIHDFYGFPRKYYGMTYPAPGAPELASRVRALLASSWPIREDPERGLDHGAYVPLLGMYPDADIPVLQLSIPTMEPATLIAIGQALAPLRREGVLLMGSGFLTHNMSAIDMRPEAPVPAWASEFDGWVSDALARKDVDALQQYKERAPGVGHALPTHEHFVPVLLSLGAGLDDDEVVFPIDGFTYGSFTKRSVQFGS